MSWWGVGEVSSSGMVGKYDEGDFFSCYFAILFFWFVYLLFSGETSFEMMFSISVWNASRCGISVSLCSFSLASILLAQTNRTIREYDSFSVCVCVLTWLKRTHSYH